jgi:hypothetical protein
VKRRIILHLAAFLILGAIVNVAVAWGLAKWFRTDFHRAPELEHSEIADKLRSIARVSASDIDFSHELSGRFLGRFGSSATMIITIPLSMHPSNPPGLSVDLTERRAGWPANALWGAWSDVFDMRADSMTTKFHAAWVVPGESFDYYRANYLPLRPLWPGFAVNTVFYAAILWLLFAGVGFARRRRRIRRGLCPACAYPVGVSPVCTECGGAVGAKSGGR